MVTRTLGYIDTLLQGHFITRTLHYKDTSLRGPFVIWTLRYWETSLNGHFVNRTNRYKDKLLNGHFITWKLRYLDTSLQGHFVTWTIRYQDTLLQGQIITGQLVIRPNHYRTIITGQIRYKAKSLWDKSLQIYLIGASGGYLSVHYRGMNNVHELIVCISRYVGNMYTVQCTYIKC